MNRFSTGKNDRKYFLVLILACILVLAVDPLIIRALDSSVLYYNSNFRLILIIFNLIILAFISVTRASRFILNALYFLSTISVNIYASSLGMMNQASALFVLHYLLITISCLFLFEHPLWLTVYIASSAAVSAGLFLFLPGGAPAAAYFIPVVIIGIGGVAFFALRHRLKLYRHTVSLESYLESLFMSAGFTILIFNMDKRLLYFNDTARKTMLPLSGKQPETNDSLDSLFPGQDFISCRENITAALGGSYITGEYEWKKDSGSPAWYEISYSPITDKDKLIGAAVIITDITSRKNAEMENRSIQGLLTMMNETLEQRITEEVRKNRQKEQALILQSRQAMMGEMMSSIAHQWRQPLTVLGILVQEVPYYFENNILTLDKTVAFSEKSMKLIRHMSQTIEDFKNFFKPSRIEEPFTLARCLGMVLELMDASFKHNSITVRQNLQDGLTLFGRMNEFSQVLLNILTNAKEILVERKTAEPLITVSGVRSDGRIILTIEDNAGGIPPDLLEKIFDNYFTTREQGTGIGLYLSRVIVEQNMSGSLTAENTGEGALFRLVLPEYNPSGHGSKTPLS